MIPRVGLLNSIFNFLAQTHSTQLQTMSLVTAAARNTCRAGTRGFSVLTATEEFPG